MKFLSNIRDQILVGLKWAGDAAHRRAIGGAIVGGVALWMHKDIDSTFVDNMLLIAIPALTAAWSRHTPEITAPEPTSTDGDAS